ncbi:hypothetical protein M2135_001382 [Parabacteroides sp. PF5-9]|nr:hypothetical protein [Parabacteroides sp. PF5-9]
MLITIYLNWMIQQIHLSDFLNDAEDLGGTCKYFYKVI